VARARFRADLFHRLNVIEFRLKPLRERSAEVIPLAHTFLADHRGVHARAIVGIAPDAVQALESYSWPGNVRELRNVIERVVALGEGSSIRLADLPDAIRAYRAVGHPLAGLGYFPPPTGSVLDSRRDEESVRVFEALQKHSNNRVRAARELGISRVTLYKKLRKYGLMANGQAAE
jgi:DNA-binding NtrC family response regulator